MARNSSITKFSLLWAFLSGLETYYIAPSAWHYIKSLDQTKFFLAMTLISFNITSVIAGPVIGFFLDRFGNPSFMFFSSCVAKVFGCMIYSINLNAYFPLFGRMISGLSDGAGFSILFAQVALQADKETGGNAFLHIESMYIAGSALSPGLASVVTFRVDAFGWEINDGNSPGIVLTIIWLLFLIVSLILPNKMWVNTVARYQTPIAYSSDDENDEISSEYLGNGNRKSLEYVVDKKSNMKSDSRIFCLLFLIFTSEFFSSTSSFYVPLLAEDHFHLQLFHTKLLFLDSAMFTLVVFLSFHIASYYIDERKIFVISLFLQIIAISLLLSLAFFWDEIVYYQYYIMLLYLCFGMPYFAYPFGISILSRITDQRNATFIQGIGNAVLNLAIVLSRVIISFVFTKISLICYCFAFVFIWVIGFLWYGVVYNGLLQRY